MDKRWIMSRRALLGGLSAAGLSALLPARSRGQTGGGIAPRLLVVHVPEGMWNGAPRPTAGGTDLGPILEPLQPYQDRLVVLNNLSMKSRDQGPGGDGHHRGVPHMLTGTEMLDDANAGGASVDQKIAQVVGAGSSFSSLQFAVRIVYGDTNGRPLWSAPGRAVPAMQDPFQAYDRIFQGVSSESGTSPMGVLNLRKSVLDHSLADLVKLRSELGAPDRALLDSYHDSLRDIERRLEVTSQARPAACQLPTLGERLDVAAERNYPAIGRLQTDLIVAAFQCGVTRVASLQWGNSNDQCTYSWLGVNALGHDLAHNNNNVDPTGAKKLKVYQWYSQQFAYLLQRLASTPEGPGSMLDNTVVLWASEFGDSNGHSSDNLMWLLMGNAGGYFRSGRVVDCRGRSTNDVHVTLCNAFGLPDRTFGNPAYCSGPMSELV